MIKTRRRGVLPIHDDDQRDPTIEIYNGRRSNFALVLSRKIDFKNRYGSSCRRLTKEFPSDPPRCIGINIYVDESLLPEIRFLSAKKISFGRSNASRDIVSSLSLSLCSSAGDWRLKVERNLWLMTNVIYDMTAQSDPNRRSRVNTAILVRMFLQLLSLSLSRMSLFRSNDI